MPNIHEYNDDPGYYIYARPPEAGNITYGIDELAYPIFDKLGYEDGDSIPWSVIQILKELGLDDTDGEGTTPDINDIRSNNEFDSAKFDQERFFDALVETVGLSEEDGETVRSILELESVDSPDNIADKWTSIEEKKLDNQMEMTLSLINTTHLLDGKKTTRSPLL